MCMAEWCHFAPACRTCNDYYRQGPSLPLLCVDCCEAFNKIDHRAEFFKELDMDWDFE
jgi:hypothetical protein